MPPDSRRLAFWLGGSRSKLPKVYESASPASFVSPDDPPMFFYHGQEDALVKLGEPKAMAAKLKESGVTAEVLAIPETGHLKAFFHRKALAEGIEFLDKHLARYEGQVWARRMRPWPGEVGQGRVGMQLRSFGPTAGQQGGYTHLMDISRLLKLQI